MKHKSSLFTALLLIFAMALSAQTGSPAGSIEISSSPGLYGISVKWAEVYKNLNPGSNVSVAIKDGIPVNGIEVTEDPVEAGWKMAVGHDAIVAVINAGNPMLEKILRQGISARGFAGILTAAEKPDWGDLLEGEQKMPFSWYITGDAAVRNGIAKFANTQVPGAPGTVVASPGEFISAIQKDRYAAGFCRLSDVLTGNSDKLAENIMLLPVDRNGNRRIDYFENIYATPSDFLRGVWIGKYPNELAGTFFIAAQLKPIDESTIEFLSWIVKEGGQFLNSNGFSELAATEKELALLSLGNIKPAIAEGPHGSYAWLLILTGLMLAGILTVILKTVKSKKPAYNDEDIIIAPALDENAIRAPRGLFFDRTHTWAFMEKDGLVRMGIDDFLQHLTGRLTRVRMKEPGEKVIKGEKILTIIHEGKQLEIHSPVSGIIKEKNSALASDSSLINSSPYSEGWVYMIEPRNWLRETGFLLMSEKYKEWLRGEFLRLKDFFATAVRSNTLVYEHVVLQDGGQITDNILADLGPEVWEDFQSGFIDAAR